MNKRVYPFIFHLLLLLLIFAAAYMVTVPSHGASGKDAVYTSLTGSGETSSGNGTVGSPYNLFKDALAAVNDGGTIYISGEKAFINGEAGSVPFIINKNVTIKPAPGNTMPSLQVRSGGIFLQGDVTFENIYLNFENATRDSIFVNGCALNLTNVAYSRGSRLIDLFAGGLRGKSGGTGRITITVDSNFSGESTFGNIYGGSMDSPFSGDAVIEIRALARNKLSFGAIYASGAHEADPGNMMNPVEPDPPEADPEAYPVAGSVLVKVQDFNKFYYYGAGAQGGANLSASMDSLATLRFSDLKDLIIENGQVALDKTTNQISGTLNISQAGLLDLTENPNFQVKGDVKGSGTFLFSREGTLEVGGLVYGTHTFKTRGGPMSSTTSGEVMNGHTYITAAGKDADAGFLFTPISYQSDLQLIEKGTTPVRWTIGTPDTITPITNLKISPVRRTLSVEEFMKSGGESYNLAYSGDSIALKNFDFRIDDQDPLDTDFDLYLYKNTLMVTPVSTPQPGIYTLSMTNPDSGVQASAELELTQEQPTTRPTAAPTTEPSTQTPTTQPTAAPTTEPSTQAPTTQPTTAPTTEPSTQAPTKPAPILVSGVTMNNTSLRVPSGNKSTLKAQVTPTNAANKTLRWSSSNTRTATVDKNGTLIAKDPGTAVITAESTDGSSKKAVCTIIVGYKVSYVLNGGTNHKDNQGVYYAAESRLKEPVRAKYTFAGWYRDKAFRYRITAIPKNTDHNHTLYAKWSKVKVNRTVLSSIKKKNKGKAVIKWKKTANAKGYDLLYASNKKFKKGTKRITSEKTSTTLKKLKRGRTYYIKIRAYTYDSAGKRIYGPYSKVKSVKIR